MATEFSTVRMHNHINDIAFASHLLTDLKAFGVQIWRSNQGSSVEDLIAQFENTEIPYAILFTIVSQHYLNKSELIDELSTLIKQTCLVVVIQISDIVEEDLPTILRDTPRIDFRNWRDHELYERSFSAACAHLKESAIQVIGNPVDPQTSYLHRLKTDLNLKTIALEAALGFPNVGTQTLTDLNMVEIYSHYPLCSCTLVLDHSSTTGDDGEIETQQVFEDIHEANQVHSKFILIGSPGSGKTYLLQELAYRSMLDRTMGDPETPIPLFLNFSHWKQQASLQSFLSENWNFDSNPLDEAARGQIHLFFDDIGEIARDETRMAELIDWLNGENPPQHIVMTCRSDAEQTIELLNLSRIRIVELDEPQIYRYIREILRDPPEVLLQLSQKIDYNDTWTVAQLTNALQIKLLTYLHTLHPEDEVPATTGDLIEKYFQTLWNIGQTNGLVSGISRKEMTAALSDLAVMIFDRRTDSSVYLDRAVAEEYVDSELIQAAARVHLLTLDAYKIRFTSHLLQTFFAADGIHMHVLRNRMPMPRFDDSGRRLASQWDDVVRVKLTLSKQPDSMITELALVDPFLAFELCEIRDDIRDVTYDVIVTTFKRLHKHGFDHRMKAFHLLVERDKNASVSLLLAIMHEADWDIRVEADQLLAQIDVPLLEGLDIALDDSAIEMHQSTLSVLRELGEAAIPTLLHIVEHGNPASRRGAAWAIGEMNIRAAAPRLVNTLSDEDARVSSAAVSALHKIQDTATIPFVIQMLYHENWQVRMIAAEATTWMGQPAIKEIVNLLENKDNISRRLCVTVLSNIDSPITVPTLLKFTEDDDAGVRAAAIAALRDSRGEDVVERLVELLFDNEMVNENKRVCDVAANSLTLIGTDTAIAAVESWRVSSMTRNPQSETVSDDASKSRVATGDQPDEEGLEHAANGTASDGNESTAAGQNPPPFNTEALHEKREAVFKLRDFAFETAYPQLSEVLDSGDIYTRIAAIQVLASFKHQEAIDTLVACLASSDYIIRDSAGAALNQVGPDAQESVMEFLESGKQTLDANTRALTIETLGSIGDTTCIPLLKEFVRDTEAVQQYSHRVCDVALRSLYVVSALDALSLIQDNEGEILPDVITRPISNVQPDQTTGISEPAQESDIIAGGEYSGVVLNLLDDLHDENWEIRIESAKALREYSRALRRVNAPELVSQLVTSLDDPMWEVRWTVAEALAWIADKAAVPKLEQKLDDSNWMVRVAAVRALAEINDTETAGQIARLLNDPHNIVREAAAETLGKLGSHQVLKEMEDALSDEEPFVRYAVVEALHSIDDPQTSKLLIRALDDEEDAVRWIAAKGISTHDDASIVSGLSRRLSDTTRLEGNAERVCDFIAVALENIDTDESRAVLEEWHKGHGSNDESPQI